MFADAAHLYETAASKSPAVLFNDTHNILTQAPSLADCLHVVFGWSADVWRNGFCSATQMNNRKEDMEISSHYRQLLRELNEQRQHGILCDACVIVDGKIFKAHKNVLLGSSRYFKTLYCQVRYPISKNRI